MRMLDLFSGIGGISLAAEWAGIETVAFCEIEPFPQKVLKKHWPDVPIYDDVRELTLKKLEKDRVIDHERTIDIISGGYPCQPFSNAGKREGEEDDRHLWPEMFRLVRELRPTWVVGENVAGHISLGLDGVLADLESEDYTCRAFVFPTLAIGAPQRRDRVFVVGYTEYDGQFASTVEGSVGQTSHNITEREDETCELTGASGSRNDESMANTEGERCGEAGKYQSERSEEWFAGSRETMANPESHPERGLSLGEETKYTGLTRGSETMSNPGSTGREKLHSSEKPNQQGYGTGGDYQGRAIGPTESRMGRVPDGLPARLDEHRWPAWLGQEQYEWEPPRVATGVPDRDEKIKALGNAVVPQQIYPIFRAIREIHEGSGRDDHTR